MIGTAHLGFDGDPAAFSHTPDQVQQFLDEIATAHPQLSVDPDDIALVHSGLLPVSDGGRSADVRLLKHPRIIDHAVEGCPGAMSVVTVKFTTANAVANHVLDRIMADRGARGRPDRVVEPLPGGAFESLEQLRTGAKERYGGLLPADVLEHLVRTYGARYRAVIEALRHVEDWDRRVVPEAPVIRAQLIHGALAEQGRTAADLLWRRTELGPRGLANAAAHQVAEEVLTLAGRAGGGAPVLV
jgi:glycerol-3-phosphate dehydrogenase